METLIKNEVTLKTPGAVKELIRDMGGMYDDHNNWIPLDSRKILGVVKLANESLGCAVILDARYQSINGLYLDDDMKLHISDWSIGGVLWGNLNQESVDKYNQSITLEGCKIKSFELFN